MSSSVGFNSPLFGAYSYLTLALPLEMRHEGYDVLPPKISYSDFVNEIESGKVVNQNYATSILPQQVSLDFKNIESLYGSQGTTEYNLVQKAYELGMVDPNTGLLNTNVNIKG